MNERIDAELALIQQRFPDAEYREEGCWFRVPSYPLPDGWNRTETDVAFQVAQGYPGQPPYGFCVPSGILFQGNQPSNYTEPIANQPPFGGTWGQFSWVPEDGHWRPAVDIRQGSNLLNWVTGFEGRFRDGQ